MRNLILITTNHNEEILGNNVKKSDVLNHLKFPLIIADDQKNVSKSYNNGLKTAYELGVEDNDLLMFAHEDVYFPDTFFKQFQEGVKNLPDNWGVLGVAGVRLPVNGKRVPYGNIMSHGRNWGRPITEPVAVQTVDELMLIVNQKSGIKFDEQFDLHFYGADICMQAHANELGVYSVPGLLHHNSKRPPDYIRDPAFVANRDRFREKWKEQLPVCMTYIMLNRTPEDKSK